jgi:RNA polymerase sigma factor (sigma-70 family)
MTDWLAIVSAQETRLWRTAYRILRHQDDALDCCQQAIVDAYEYSLTHKVDRWEALLVSLTTRRSIDRLRQRSRMRAIVVPLPDDSELASCSDCPVELTEAAELIDRLRATLAELPAKQGQVFWLSCIERTSHDDIASCLGISVNESRVLLHRARSRLASLINRQSSDARHRE